MTALGEEGTRWVSGVSGSVATLGNVLLLTGCLLLVVNVVGILLPLRAAEIDGYVDFAGTPTTTASRTFDRLRAIDSQTVDLTLVTEATHVFHEGFAHVLPDDVVKYGVGHYGMRVPVTENWVLFALSFLKPDTYRDYEFCSYRKAIERGTGRCGQQSMALASFLEERGVEVSFVKLGGHALARARTDDAGWVLLDPDYGGVIPFDLDVAEVTPASVLPYYWSDAAQRNELHLLFAPQDNSIRMGAAEERFPRVCPIERLAYTFKWLFPLLLVLPVVVRRVLHRKHQAHGIGVGH